jgi:hypothetical protein
MISMNIVSKWIYIAWFDIALLQYMLFQLEIRILSEVWFKWNMIIFIVLSWWFSSIAF